MQGFKSFPDRLRVEFHRGMTGIVGPNGSGKSNIADAIRWVLGEQSTKALRGSKMEDVIFAGSADRRRMGFAEVSLTLDNADGALKTDYNEVTVTRRFYRSGESEYYINKKSVRLRDVHELFMDTGIGRDGYSVIGQGRIDEILSVKADDRREIFDEAAGITKFRWRREEAEHKLEAASENLERVTDLINEMESRLEPMAKQAEKERTYNALRDELKGIEVGYWLERLDEADAESEQVTANLNTAAKELEDAAARASGYEERAQKIGAELRTLEEERENLRTNSRECSARAAEAGSRAALKTAAAENNRENRARFERETKEYERRIADAEKQLSEARNALVGLEQKSSEAGEKLRQAAESAAKITRRMEDAGTVRERIHAEERALREDETAARERLSSASALADSLREQLAGQETNERERETAKAAAMERLNACEEACKKAAAGVKSAENVLAGYERMRASWEKRERDAREAHTGLRIRQGDIENRLRLLRELEREYEGYAKAVRAVMARKDSLGGIRGPVSGLLQADDEVVAAIETALGAAGGNIVVDTEEDARRAIGMLKSRDEGRATFLPLSVIRGGELLPREYETLPGVVGLASRLVRFDADYTQVFRNLLGRVIVIDNIDNAILAARASNHRYKLVTLDGQVLSPGGAMTGGSMARSSGVLTRANELKRLETAREECTEDLGLAARDAEEARREYNALGVKSDAARDSLDRARESLNAAERERDLERAALENLSVSGNEAREELNRRLEAAMADVESAGKALEASRAALDENSERENACAEETAKINDEAKLAGETVEHARAAYEEARRETAGCAAKIQALETQVETARADAARHETERRDYDAEALVLEQEAADARREQSEMQEQIRALEDALQGQIERRTALEAARVEAERAGADESHRQIALEREKVRLENRLENARHAQDSLSGSLWEEYGLTRTTAREYVTAQTKSEPQDAREIKRRCEELRRKLKALGSVYTGAIEEYAKLKERYDFCMNQKEDAETSKKKLTAVISELSAEMKKQFSEQFAVLTTTFEKTFREIFGGGKATLELENPESVLESGIEIKVQLPGKTMKSLSLLSGGERAFVAIALYFAILRVRPTPFCILDEIDAALDDVNVGRFARYLRGYTDHTQFIVITHRRNTMEEADMLYGVAMPTQGISKLLPFNVSDAMAEMKI